MRSSALSKCVYFKPIIFYFGTQKSAQETALTSADPALIAFLNDPRITGATKEEAEQFLQIFGGDLDAAISMYLENKLASEQQQSMISTRASSSNSNNPPSLDRLDELARSLAQAVGLPTLPGSNGSLSLDSISELARALQEVSGAKVPSVGDLVVRSESWSWGDQDGGMLDFFLMFICV